MHKDKYLVSVIIPVFNAQQFIHSTVASVLQQTYQNIELILVDDKSSDQSYDFISKLAETDDRVRCYQMPVNTGGPAGPRNKGLDLARGKFVAFLDDDDLWVKEKLEIQLTEMQRLGLNFSSTKAVLISGNTDSVVFASDDASSSVLKNLSFDTLIRKNVIITSSVVCERDLIGNNRFSTEAHHIAVEDYVLWLHLHTGSMIKSAILPQKIVGYRVRAGSISRSKWNMAIKIWRVLSEVESNGCRLGIKKWRFFAHYIVSSLRNATYK